MTAVDYKEEEAMEEFLESLLTIIEDAYTKRVEIRESLDEQDWNYPRYSLGEIVLVWSLGKTTKIWGMYWQSELEGEDGSTWVYQCRNHSWEPYCEIEEACLVPCDPDDNWVTQLNSQGIWNIKEQ